MQRQTTLVREIESLQAKIAVRRQDRARIDDEISDLVAANKAKIMMLVATTFERLDLSNVPVSTLLLSLSKVTADTVHQPTSLAAAGNIPAFVRFGRNASPSNRELLVAAGLHWNGREGGWVGQVTEAQIADLRRTFGGRLEKPEAIRAEMTRAGPLDTLRSRCPPTWRPS